MAFYPPSGTAQELTLTANVQLDYPYSADTNNVTVTDVIDVSATAPNLNIFLPDATLTGNGFAITFNNVGENAFNVVLNDKITVLTDIAQGVIKTIYLYDNSTVNGSWRIIPFGGGTNAISTLNLTSSDNSITVTNGAITPPGGTINAILPTIISSIQSLTNYVPGIVVVNPNNPLSWGAVSLTNGSNITITNVDGSTGNPTIGLSNNISVTQITAGKIVINNDLITNTDSSGVLNITSNGTDSTLNLNSVLVDTQGDVSGINNLTVDGIFKSPSTAKAWCRFSNTSGSLATLALYGISGITYNSSNYQYTINFTTPMDNVNYGVFITCANNNSTPPLQTRLGYDVVRQTASVTIVLTDGSGEILQDIPEGVSVMIFSLN
jgi:hypothetical protein